MAAAGAAATFPTAQAGCDDTGACWLIPPEVYPTLECRSRLAAGDLDVIVRCYAGGGQPDTLLVAAQGSEIPTFTANTEGWINVTITRSAGASRPDPSWTVLFKESTAVGWVGPRTASGVLAPGASAAYAQFQFQVPRDAAPGRVDLDYATWDQTEQAHRGAVAFSVIDTGLGWQVWMLVLLAAAVVAASFLLSRKP